MRSWEGLERGVDDKLAEEDKDFGVVPVGVHGEVMEAIIVRFVTNPLCFASLYIVGKKKASQLNWD